MHAWIAHLARLAATATPAVLVTVAATRGSTPRAPGARMIVTFDGSSHGSIGGGRLEQRANEIARELLAAGEHAPRLERFALGASLGQCCGGVVHLLFEPVGAAQHAWIEHAAALASAGRAWGRRIRLAPPDGAEVQVFDADSLERVCTAPAQAAHARSLLAGGADGALLVAVHGSDTSSGRRGASGERVVPDPSGGDGASANRHRSPACRDGGDGGDGGNREDEPENAQATLLDASPPPALQVLLFGAGHVGRALAEVFGRLPLRVRWIDPRAEEFPAAVASNIEVRCTDAPESEVRQAPPDAVFLVLTHSHALDFELVRAILGRDDFRLCGLLGSHSKRARFAQRLRARGVAEHAIARLCCPLGVPGLAGKEPEVIAIAIAAQVLQLRGAAHAAHPLRGEALA